MILVHTPSLLIGGTPFQMLSGTVTRVDRHHATLDQDHKVLHFVKGSF
jgi:hypothetical protein